MPRALLLNHYQPPDAAPTARLLGELGTALESRGWDVELVGGSRQGYRGSVSGRLGKAFGWFRAHVLLLVRGVRAGPCDLVLCLTDPPFLLLTARIVARLHGARLTHWVMDLYPDLAVELGEFPPGVGRVFDRLMGQAYRGADLLVALDHPMAERLAEHGLERPAAVVSPWVGEGLDAQLASVGEGRGASDEGFVWLYSGNLGRAHEFDPLLRIQEQLERRGIAATLVFQGRGARLEEARALACELGLRGCEFRDYVPEGELVSSLLAADLLVATLCEPLGGMLWPSKLALLEHLPRPLLWIGPEGDISKAVRERETGGLALRPGEWERATEWIAGLAGSNGALSAGGNRIGSHVAVRGRSLDHLCDLLSRSHESEAS